MKKPLKYSLIGLVALVLIVGGLVSLVLWALNTAEGTRALLKTISVFSPLRIEAREISGRLRDDLTIRGLRVKWSGGEFFTEIFHLRWEAAELLNYRVIVHEISLDGGRIKDDRPETKGIFFPGWPQTPLWLSRFEGRVDSLRVEKMLYQRGRGEPVRIGALSTVLLWDGEVLRVKNFSLDSSPGRAEGSMEMGFSRPRLNLDLRATLAKESAGMDALLVHLRLGPVEKPEEARGAFKISGQKEGHEKLRCEGNLELTRAALTFQNIRLAQAERRGAIQAGAEIPFSEKPNLRIWANVSKLDLAPELGRATDLSGKIEVEGSWDAYRGRVTFVNRSKGLEKIQGAIVFRGNLENLEILDLEVAWLGGSVKGPLKISWNEGTSVQGKLQARKLNLSVLDPEWNGEINLDAEGKFLSPPGKPSGASFRVGLLKGRLFERDFSGSLDGRWQEGLLKISVLHLCGQGFDLKGKGTLQEKLSVEATVSDLAALIPEAKGQIKASGWLRYKEDRLSGIVQAEGKDFLVKEIKAGNLRAEIQLKEYSPKATPLISAEVKARDVQAGSLKVPGLNLQVAGTPASHGAQFGVTLEGAGVQGALTGGYGSGTWKGTLQKLDGRDDRGSWNLQAPAEITLSADQFRLSALDLKSAQGERLTARADLNLKPASGTFQAQWQNLDLARANPWMGPGKLSGQTSGSVSGAGQKEGWQVSGKARFKGTFARDRLRVEVSSGTVDLNWNGKGLLAEAALKLNQRGDLKGKLSSAEAFRFALPGEGRVEVDWKEIDLGLVQSFLPDPFVLKGKISGNFTGGWLAKSRFEAAGKAGISQGQFIWKGGATKPITVSLNKAEADFAWRGEELQGNLAIASADYGGLEGRFLLPLAASFSPSFNREGPLTLSLRGQLQEKKILPTLYPEWFQTSRGRVELDLRADGTFGHPRFKGTLGIFDAGFQMARPSGATQKGPVRAPLDLEIPSAEAAVDWGSKGLLSVFNATLNKIGKIEAKVTSPEPARLGIPEQGKIDVLWKEIDLVALQPLLPEGFLLEGRVDGTLRGAWLPEFHKSPQPSFAKGGQGGILLDLAGGLKVTRGKLTWRGEKSLISTQISQAGLEFLWAGERLQGDISVVLADYGSLKGDFRLPLPARPPFRFDPAGPVRVSLQGKAQEKGLISALFPATVEETRGNIDLDFRVDGTWAQPNPGGSLLLTNAAASLPLLGIRIEDLSSRCELRNGKVQVQSLRARSGPGQVEGTGTIWLKGWKLERFEGNLKGERFQVLYQPNLRIQAGPNLQFQGTPQKVSVRGEILLPEVLIYEISPSGVAKASPDVVITDRTLEKKPALSLDLQVRVTLGDRVQVKAGGIDARLAGNLDLKILGLKPEDISARGEVRLAEGFYSGYGLSLRIDRGRFIFAGGAVDNPDLDILALRRSDDVEKLYNVKVGVAIFGSLKSPKVKLYSQPAMKDQEILSYLVLARPYDPKEGNLSLLLFGAGGVLAGDSLGTLDQIKKRAGIDTVDIQSGSGDMTRSMVTIGKYLTPQLYVSYGYGVLSEEQMVKVRYRLSKRWEVETFRGNAMGVDLYYRIEFY